MGIKLDHSVRLEKSDMLYTYFSKEYLMGKSSGTSLHFMVPSRNLLVLITAPGLQAHRVRQAIEAANLGNQL